MPGRRGDAAFDLVVPTLGRSSLSGLLVALAGCQGPRPGRVIMVDDRRHRPGPLLRDPAPGWLAGLVEVLEGPGRGPAAARNVGWRASGAAWVAFLDDDVVPGDDWLAELATDLASAPGTAVASEGHIRVPLPVDRRPTDWERNVRCLETARWITADMAVRWDALAHVGGFDERFPRPYREDADLALRLRAAGGEIVQGRRVVEHPVRPAPWWVSTRLQAGNRDDVLMAALHGRRWHNESRWSTRRPRHLATTALAVAGTVGLAGHVPIVGALGASGWLLGTAELAWARIAPGPRDRREVAAMVATSLVLPPVATFHWLAGLARRRRLLHDTARAPRPGPLPAEAAPPRPRVPDPTRASLPRSLQVEVTAACNLRCHMCLVRYRPPVNRITGSMSYEAFTELLDGLPDVDDLTLQGLGEPLLAPDLLRIVSYASSRGIKVGFNTNATLLTREKAEALVRAGLDWLCVSLDGATAETYESIRDGARFDRVGRNVQGLLEVRREQASDRPEVSLVFVAMSRNVHELPDLVRLAADWGVDRVSVQNLAHSFDDTSPESDYQEIRAFTAGEALWAERAGTAEDSFGEARRVAGERGVRLHLPRLEERPPRRAAGAPGCDWPWRAAYVQHDGQLQPCCMVMGSDRAVLGNLAEQPFPELWEGEAYRSFRAALLTDDPPAVCRGCSLYRRVF